MQKLSNAVKIQTSKHDNFPPVFVINMEKQEKRRLHMSGILQQFGFDFSFINATDGNRINIAKSPFYDRRKRMRYFGRDMLPAEIGCSLSHRTCFRKMLEDGLQHVLILEDDVVFEKDFPEILSKVMEHAEYWDILRFVGSKKLYKKGSRKLVALNDNYHLCRLPTAPGGAHAYIINRKAALKLLEMTEKNWVPIDTILGRCLESGLNVLSTTPAPLYADEKEFGSDIGQARFDKTIKLRGKDKFLFPFFRGFFKFCEILEKKFVYCSYYFNDQKYKKKQGVK